MKYLLFLFAIALFLVAETRNTGSAQNSWVRENESARFESLRRSGLDALYDLDYDKALKDFTEMTRLFPQHPAGPQLLAARLWLKTLYESRRLQTSLYSSDSFYTRGDDKVDPAVVGEFRNLTRKAKQLAEARLKTDPHDIEAIEFLGAAAGLKASFEEAVERRHFVAIRDGSEAVDRYRDVLKLNPNYVDAYLTVGLYDYVVGSLPLPQKILAGIAGLRGSKKRGLAALERVAKEGRWSSDDAKSLLILLYSREQRFADALATVRELSAKYPRNYLFRLETADALVSYAVQQRKAGNAAAATQSEREAFKTFDDLLKDRTVRQTVSHALDLVHFKYGEILLTAGLSERARTEFFATIKVEGAEPALVTMSHLYAGRTFDLEGKRDEATAQYRQVLARADIFDAHDAAKQGLREAYRTDVKQASNEAQSSQQ